MYKKALSLLLLGNLIVFMGFFCVKKVGETKLAFQPVRQLKLELEELEAKATEREEASLEETAGNAYMGLGVADSAVSGQRVVDYHMMEKEPGYCLSDEDMEALLRIVEAEAGCEDEEGKLLVANVVLNRVNHKSFPDTVTEVILQKENGVTQFSPVANGRYSGGSQRRNYICCGTCFDGGGYFGRGTVLCSKKICRQ